MRPPWNPFSPADALIEAQIAPLSALLVEDSAADAELISLRLERAAELPGATRVDLLQCASAASACVLLGFEAVDVVILDLTLPDAHGLEALHRVREAAPGTPIIVLSGVADAQLALRALRAGAQDYVLKPPPDGPTLSRILRYACERQHLLKELDLALRTSAAAAERWRLLAEVGRVLAASSDSRAAVADAINLIVPYAADCMVVFVAEDHEVPELIEVGHVDAERGREVRAEVRALAYRKATAADASLFAGLGISTGTVIPLAFGGAARGFVVVGATQQDGGAGADVDFVRSLADRIAMALEQDRLLRQTRRAVDARDRAVGIVSHDLRNPLSTIHICATALLDPEPVPPTGMRQMAGLIVRSAEWMQHTVQALLDRSSLDAGRLTLHRRPTSVAEVIGAIEALFGPIAAEHSIDFVMRSTPGLPMLDADPDRLLQALSNLISNAVKFTPAGGRVELAAHSEEPSSIRFSVNDTGPGIAPEDLAHVFEWFWRSPDGGGGAGLGLAIAKGLIEAHRGRLHVESAPGGGSTFWFTVPATSVAVERRDAEMLLA